MTNPEDGWVFGRNTELYGRGEVPGLPGGVALTAAAMAREREVETAKGDGLVDDPWAHQLVGAAAASASAETGFWLGEGTTLADIVPGMEAMLFCVLAGLMTVSSPRCAAMTRLR